MKHCCLRLNTINSKLLIGQFCRNNELSLVVKFTGLIKTKVVTFTGLTQIVRYITLLR